MYPLYTLLYLIGIVGYLPKALLRKRGVTALRHRLGRVPHALRAQRGAIWIHAVSVGEVHAARALLPQLRAGFPGTPVVLSTTTATGQELARGAGADAVFYVPLDLPMAIHPYLSALAPRAVLLVETEIWPHLVRACGGAGIPVVLVNGRLSPRSFRRYRLLARWWPAPLRALTAICARTDVEAARFAALGIDAARVWVTGNLKGEAAALSPPDELRRELAAATGFGEHPVLVAGCTMAGEEALVLDAFAEARASVPELRLLVAPRHPERFEEAARLAAARGYRVRRRTGPAEGDADVFVLDTIGELPAAYGLGTVSFVGGSLVPTGGHNLLEPAIQGQPVLYGPHMDNFAALAAAFEEAEAGVAVADPSSLAEAVVRLAGEPERRRVLGARARELASRDAGAAARTLRRLRPLLESRA